MTRRK